MASTVLVRDALWRVSVLLQDITPQFQRFPERELVHWFNDGQVAVTKFLPAACSRLDSIKLVAGTKQSIQSIPAANCLPGDGTTPTAPIYGTQLLNLIRNMGSDGLTAGRAITCVEREILDTNDDLWHTRTGTYIKSFCYDENNPRYFYVTPGVTGTMWVDASFTAQPIAIQNTAAAGSEAYLNSGSSTTTISIADEYLDDLVNYTVARASLKDSKYADPAKAKLHTELFIASLNAKVAAIKGASPNIKHLPIATPGP